MSVSFLCRSGLGIKVCFLLFCLFILGDSIFLLAAQRLQLGEMGLGEAQGSEEVEKATPKGWFPGHGSRIGPKERNSQ